MKKSNEKLQKDINEIFWKVYATRTAKVSHRLAVLVGVCVAINVFSALYSGVVLIALGYIVLDLIQHLGAALCYWYYGLYNEKLLENNKLNSYDDIVKPIHINTIANITFLVKIVVVLSLVVYTVFGG